MRIRLIVLCALLLVTACSEKKSTPVQEAIKASVSGQLGELKSMEFSELLLVDSTTFGDEIARRRKAIELRHSQNQKYAAQYKAEGKPTNARKKLEDAAKDEKVLAGIDAIGQRLAEHDSLGVIELYIWKFSGRAFPADGGSVSVDNMYIAITPENKVEAMDYNAANLLKGTGRLIPGYPALFDNQ